MKKRIRSVNFTLQETELLVSLIESNIDIIESKKCDSVTWQEKEFTWKTIETDFNRSNLNGEVFRDAKCLRLKFDSLKRDTRKKERIIQHERYNLGSFCGTNINTTRRHHFTDLERKVKDMIVPSAERQESLSDSDQADVKNFPFELPPIETNEDNPPADDEHYENNEVEYEDVEEKPFQGLTANLSILDDSGVAAARSPLTTDTNEPKLHHSRIDSSSEVTSKTHSAFNKNKLKKRKLAEDKLAEAKLEVVNFQKQLIQQEIKKEIAQTKVFQQEYEHKRQIQELEKRHLLLKIKLTETELENAKKNKDQ